MKRIVESAETRLKETARGYINRKHLDLAVVVADQIDYKIASLNDKDVERFSKRGMGGIGVGLSTNKFINHLNPASIVNRDTLSFMLDFGVEQKNIYNSNGNLNSAYNVFNMHNLIITAPIMKKSASWKNKKSNLPPMCPTN
jgi:hypothetical protein